MTPEKLQIANSLKKTIDSLTAQLTSLDENINTLKEVGDKIDLPISSNLSRKPVFINVVEFRNFLSEQRGLKRFELDKVEKEFINL